MRKQENVTDHLFKRQLAEFNLEMTEVSEQTRILKQFL